MDSIIIRNVRPEDLEEVAAVELACFPAAEAADKKSLKERLGAFLGAFSWQRMQEGSWALSMAL